MRVSFKFGFTGKIANFILGILYASVYDYIFNNYICDVFWSLPSANHISISSFYYILLYYMLSGLPILFYKGQISIAATISLFVYIFGYIPIVNNLLFWGYSEALIIPYSIALLISMCLLFITDGLFFFKNIMLKKRKLISFRHFEFISFFLYIFIMLVNINQLHFVNFFTDSSTMYDLRADNDTNFIYLFRWLRTAVFPLLLVCYLKDKSYLKYALTFVALLSFYMIDKQKSSAIYPVLISLLYFVVKFQSSYFNKYFHVVLILGIIVLSLIVMSNVSDPTFYTIAAIFLMRTICIEGLEFNTYIDFFEIHNHQFTYYRHVSGIGRLIGENPYPESIGLAVTGGEGNANGIFWLMDGVAAAGVAGCVIATFIVIFLKSSFNTVSLKCPTNLCVLICLSSIQAFINVSVFTSIFSYGFFALYMMFLFIDLGKLRDYGEA